MKYDALIIGGGLSALVCGIALQKLGKHTAMVSAGQSALHFSSGSFGFLSILPDATSVDRPLDVIDKLSEEHPYRKMGSAAIRKYAYATPEFFSSCGVRLFGAPEKNSWRHTATGRRKRCWLALEDTALLPEEMSSIGSKALIVNFYGYLDFYVTLIADALASYGTECRSAQVRPAALETLLQSPSEMRSVNIARKLEDMNVLKALTSEIKSLLKDEDAVILPQVFGLDNVADIQYLRDEIPVPVYFLGTMIPSVPGLRLQLQLTKAYEQAGGMLLNGDTVIGGEFEDGYLRSVRTANLEDYALCADSFVMATGSFFGRGLKSDFHDITEPVFGLDLDYVHERSAWCRKNFYSSQPYMSFGASTDKDLHPSIAGKVIPNMYVAGSLLSGGNAMNEGSGAGIAIMSAFHAAEKIIG